MMVLLEKEAVEVLADLVLDKLEEGGDRKACAGYARLYTVLSAELEAEEKREVAAAEQQKEAEKGEEA